MHSHNNKREKITVDLIITDKKRINLKAGIIELIFRFNWVKGH